MKLCVGRLFQNRYKSILCQQDPYLAVKQLGMEGTVVGKRLGVSQSAIS